MTPLSRHFIASVAVFLLLAAVALSAQTPSVISFDAPDARNDGSGGGTQPCCINKKGVIAGIYRDQTLVAHGFVRDAAGVITEFTPANLIYTVVTGLNNRGQLVGWGPEPSQHHRSIVRTADGQIFYFNFPGAVSTEASGINDNGQITGAYLSPDLVWHGFIREANGAFSTIDDPRGALTDTFPQTINNNGEIAGHSDQPGAELGFIRDGFGNFTDFDPQPGSSPVNVAAISLGGEVAGSFIAGSNPGQAFVRDATGNITDISLPNSTQTFGVSLNDAGTLLGIWYSAQSFLPAGFVRDPAGNITTFAFPHAKFGTLPAAINNNGRITGRYEDSNHQYHAFVR